MKRDVDSILDSWYGKSNHKPLIIRGSRQVGKTHSVREFGIRKFAGRVLEINFEKNPDWHSIFKTNLDVKRIKSELEVLFGRTISIGEDLLFFDEIQECPEAILALRYFYEEMPELHVIAAGSLLEFALRDIPFPVGRVELVNMNPLAFHEFLTAMNKEMLAEIVVGQPKILPPAIHEQINQHLKQYFFIGGMPECVRNFVKTNSFPNVFEIQNDLINTFRQDFLKYSPRVDTQCLLNVLDSVTRQVGSQIKYSHLSNGFTNPTIRKAFELLETARVISRVSAASPARLPLAATRSSKVFKAIFLDIGLMVRQSGLSLQSEWKKPNLNSVYQGALAEQFVGQELRAGGHELFYWNRPARSSTAETDYLAVLDKEIVPIEVKSGSKGRLRSLHLIMKEYDQIKRALVFLDAPYTGPSANEIQYVPLFWVSGLLRM